MSQNCSPPFSKGIHYHYTFMKGTFVSSQINIHVDENDPFLIETRCFDSFTSVKLSSSGTEVVYFFNGPDETLRMAQKLVGTVHAAIAIKELDEQ